MINRGENQFPKIQGTVNNFNQANEGGNVSEQSLFTQISQPPSGSINPTNAIAAPQIKQSLQKPYTIPIYPVSTIDAFEQAEKAKTKDERPETLASNIKVKNKDGKQVKAKLLKLKQDGDTYYALKKEGKYISVLESKIEGEKFFASWLVNTSDKEFPGASEALILEAMRNAQKDGATDIDLISSYSSGPYFNKLLGVSPSGKAIPLADQTQQIQNLSSSINYARENGQETDGLEAQLESFELCTPTFINPAQSKDEMDTLKNQIQTKIQSLASEAQVQNLDAIKFEKKSNKFTGEIELKPTKGKKAKNQKLSIETKIDRELSKKGSPPVAIYNIKDRGKTILSMTVNYMQFNKEDGSLKDYTGNIPAGSELANFFAPYKDVYTEKEGGVFGVGGKDPKFITIPFLEFDDAVGSQNFTEEQISALKDLMTMKIIQEYDGAFAMEMDQSWGEGPDQIKLFEDIVAKNNTPRFTLGSTTNQQITPNDRNIINNGQDVSSKSIGLSLSYSAKIASVLAANVN